MKIFFQRIKILVYFVVELLQKKQLSTFQISNSKKFMITHKNLWDQSFNNIKILNPSKIDKNDFIIIASTSYAEIVNQLIKKNLTLLKILLFHQY